MVIALKKGTTLKRELTIKSFPRVIYCLQCSDHKDSSGTLHVTVINDKQRNGAYFNIFFFSGGNSIIC